MQMPTFFRRKDPSLRVCLSPSCLRPADEATPPKWAVKGHSWSQTTSRQRPDGDGAIPGRVTADIDKTASRRDLRTPRGTATTSCTRWVTCTGPVRTGYFRPTAGLGARAGLDSAGRSRTRRKGGELYGYNTCVSRWQSIRRCRCLPSSSTSPAASKAHKQCRSSLTVTRAARFYPRPDRRSDAIRHPRGRVFCDQNFRAAGKSGGANGWLQETHDPSEYLGHQ